MTLCSWVSSRSSLTSPCLFLSLARCSPLISQTGMILGMFSLSWPFTRSCPALRDPIDFSSPGFLVPHYLPEFAPVHVHCISDAIQPSHPLSPSSPHLFCLYSFLFSDFLYSLEVKYMNLQITLKFLVVLLWHCLECKKTCTYL